MTRLCEIFSIDETSLTEASKIIDDGKYELYNRSAEDRAMAAKEFIRRKDATPFILKIKTNVFDVESLKDDNFFYETRAYDCHSRYNLFRKYRILMRRIDSILLNENTELSLSQDNEEQFYSDLSQLFKHLGGFENSEGALRLYARLHFRQKSLDLIQAIPMFHTVKAEKRADGHTWFAHDHYDEYWRTVIDCGNVYNQDIRDHDPKFDKALRTWLYNSRKKGTDGLRIEQYIPPTQSVRVAQELAFLGSIGSDARKVATIIQGTSDPVP